MDATPQTDDLLNTAQAARKLNISRRYLYELIERGLITTIRLPNEGSGRAEHRIEPEEIERFKVQHRHAGSAS